MTGLVNQQTGITEDVPDDSASDAVTSGQFSPGSSINLIEPNSGKSFNVTDPQKAKDLIDIGWSPETKDQLLKRTVKDTISNNPITSSVAALTGSFTNQAALGIPKIIREKTGDDFSKQMDTDIDEELAREHPVLNIAGGAAGMAASLLLTPLGKALGMFGDAAAAPITGAAAIAGEAGATTVARKVVGTAVKYGAENAVINLPYRVTEDVLGDPNTANEGIIAHGAEDFGIGAGFGLGTSLVGPVLKTAADFASKAVNPETLQNLANRFQLKNAGALTSEFKKLGDVTGEKFTPEQLQTSVDLINDNVDGITQFMGPNAIFNKMAKQTEKAGQQLTAIRNTVDALAPEGNVTFSQTSSALDGLEKEYSKGIVKAGSVPIDYSNMSSEDFQNNAAKYGTDTTQWPLTTPTAGISNPGATPLLKDLNYVRQRLQAAYSAKMQAMGMSNEEILQAFETGKGIPALTSNEMHGFRQSIKQWIYNEKQINGIDSEAGNDAWKAIGNIMDNNISQIAEQSGNAALKGSFKTANQTYRNLYTFTTHILENAAARAGSRNTLGLTSTILAAGGEVAAGNFGGLSGLALGFGKQHFGNYLMYQTLGKAAQALENLKGKIDGSISGFLSSDTAKAAQLGSVSIFSRYMGDKKADPQKAYAKIQNDLNLATSSPEAIAATMQGIIPGGAKFMPQNYALAGSTIQTAMQYLKDSAPQPPQPIFPGGPSRPWLPSDNDLSKYSRRMDAVFNPLSILNEVRTGTLSKESVDAVRTVYPNFFQAIQSKVQEKLAHAPPDQVYKIRRKLSLLLDGMEDPQSKAIRIQGLQGGFLPNNNHVKPRANSKIDEAGRYTTDINRVTND